ncbi:MAG: biopolymer transport protein ExbB [Lentimonas sp.]|jgi:biopolymer transport protein ExbB
MKMKNKTLGLLLVFSLFATSLIYAQNVSAAQPLVPAQGDVTLIETFKQGGLVMYPLFLFSVVAVGLTIYNAIVVRRSMFIGSATLKGEVMPALKELDFKKATAICQASSAPTLIILGAGLATTEYGFKVEQMEQAMNEAAGMELAKPFAFINYLQVIASVSPMVGLLGTVSGMVKAFRTIAEQGMGRPELLADNISEALVTTASGLIVAIPALISYFYFKNKYAKIASSVAMILGETSRYIAGAVEKSKAVQPSTQLGAEV